jgi:hypothetical protein
MRWIRGNRRIGAWAALFALAVQITLSFGHIHLDKTALSRLLAHATQLQAAADGNTPSRPGHQPGANDYCEICATIAMVASSVLPTPAAVPALVATPYSWAREFASAPPVREAHFNFQARAPPFVG